MLLQTRENRDLQADLSCGRAGERVEWAHCRLLSIVDAGMRRKGLHMAPGKWVVAATLLAGVAVGAAESDPPAEASYSITDLGTLGGSSSVALGINEVGQIVGSADTPQGYRHPYLWEEGVMTDLGMLHPQGLQCEAWDVNNHAQVVGICGNHGVMWWHGEVVNLGYLSGQPYGLTSASAINDAGQVVGQSFNGEDRNAFLWEDGVMTDLGVLGSAYGNSYSIAWDINAAGQVAGSSTTDFISERAFMWADGVMTDLGTLGLDFSQAFGINDFGVVVGWSAGSIPNRYHAFLWADGVMTNLGALGDLSGSSAEAINICGQVVGQGAREFTGPDGTEWIWYPFLYGPHTGMRSLNDLLPPDNGWSLLSPRDINDLGQIVGAGTIQHRRHAFVMTPLDPMDDDGDGIPDCLDTCPGVDDHVFAPCEPDVIPTISSWGLVVLTLVLLAGGKLYFGCRGPHARLGGRL